MARNSILVIRNYVRHGSYGNWLSRAGAFWLAACAAGPLLGWLLTDALIPTTETWRWLYAGRTVFAIVFPVATALPLTRYARGGAAFTALVLLSAVTTLPVLSAITTTLDLRDGPVIRQFVLTPTGEATLHCLSLDGGSPYIPCGSLAWGRPGDTIAVTYLRHSGKLLHVRSVTSTA